MKKKILILWFLIPLQNCLNFCYAQEVVQEGNKLNISISKSSADNFIAGNALKSGASGVNLEKKKICWLETGDGRFSTDPAKTYSNLGLQSHSPLLAIVSLYDTTRGPRPTNVNLTNKFLNGGRAMPNDNPDLYGSGLRISSNVKDIVEGDTMFFALTYTLSQKLLFNKSVSADDEYYATFYYNNNRTFANIDANALQNIDGNLVKSVRTHFKEVLTSSVPQMVGLLPHLSDYGNSFTLKLDKANAGSGIQMNFFVTAIPENNLEEGKSGSVYAALFKKNSQTQDYEVLAVDSIPNMPFVVAHDPNYMVQRPYCLKKPHKIYPFEFLIHFQNTGEGKADSVKVVANLPPGLNWETFKITKANMAGVSYVKGSEFQYNFNKLNNTITFVFKPSASSKYLMGTGFGNINPAININTMGDIGFVMKSTVNTSDTLKSFASIYFHSLGRGIGEFEEAVTTRTSMTVYKDCCDCTQCICPIYPPPPPPCIKILGLCWWWWIIILLSLIVLYIIWKRKKREPENPTNKTIY